MAPYPHRYRGQGVPYMVTSPNAVRNSVLYVTSSYNCKTNSQIIKCAENRVHRSPYLWPILSQLNPVPTDIISVLMVFRGLCLGVLSDLFHVLIFHTRTTCPTTLVIHLITECKRLQVQYLSGNVPRKCQQHCTHVPLLHWVHVESANIPRNALTCANVNWIMLSKRRYRERGNGRRERSHVNTKVYSNVWYIL